MKSGSCKTCGTDIEKIKARFYCATCSVLASNVSRKKWKDANKKQAHASSMRWAKEHPEKTKKYRQKYFASEKGKAMEKKHRNSPKRRAYMLQYKYGITPEDVQDMLLHQNGHCYFCNEEQNLEPDHDHDTMRFRGMLCGLHNRALGFFTKQQIIMAADYL